MAQNDLRLGLVSACLLSNRLAEKLEAEFARRGFPQHIHLRMALMLIAGRDVHDRQNGKSSFFDEITPHNMDMIVRELVDSLSLDASEYYDEPSTQRESSNA